jgi:predicted MFS family arabinose efflux permease
MKIQTLFLVVVLASFVGTTNAFGIYLFSIVNTEMRIPLQFGTSYVGWVTALQQGFLMLASLVASHLLSKVPALTLVIVAYFLSSVTLLITSIIQDKTPLVYLLPVSGVIAALVWIAVVAISKEKIAVEHQGKALGTIAATGTATYIFLSGFSVPYLLHIGSWRSVWLAAGVSTFAILVVASLGLYMAGKSSRTIVSEQVVPSENNSQLDMFKSRTGALILLLGLFNGLAFVPFQTYLTTYLQQDLHWSTENSSYVWSAIGLGSMIGGVVFGFISDSASARFSLLAAYASSLLVAIGILSFTNTEAIFFLLFVFGLAYGAVFGQTAAYLTRSQSPQSSAFLNAAFYVSFGFGSMAGNFIGGQLAEYNDSVVVCYYLTTAALLCLILLAMSLKKDALDAKLASSQS